jgi:hypothetical protein
MSGRRWLCLALSAAAILLVGQVAYAAALEVLHHSATIEPDIAAKSVKGTVRPCLKSQVS